MTWMGFIWKQFRFALSISNREVKMQNFIFAFFLWVLLFYPTAPQCWDDSGTVYLRLIYFVSKLKIRAQYINRETHFPYILSTMIYNFVVQRANPANGQTTNCGNPSQYSSRHSVTSLEGEKHQNMENCREYSRHKGMDSWKTSKQIIAWFYINWNILNSGWEEDKTSLNC